MNQEKQTLSSASLIGFAVVLSLFVFVLAANLNNRTVQEVAPPPVSVEAIPEATPTPAPLVGYFESDVTSGRTFYMGTCSACHGPDARGVTGLGPDLVNNAFTFGLTDQEFHDFVVQGRSAFDPANTTRVEMPPRGGNPGLSDQALDQIIAYLRVENDPTLLLPDELRPDESAVTDPEPTAEATVEATVPPTIAPTATPAEQTDDTIGDASGERETTYASDDPWREPLIDHDPYAALMSEDELYESIVAAFTLLYPNGIPDGVLPSTLSEEAATDDDTYYNPYSALPDTSHIVAPVNPFSSSNTGDGDGDE